MMILIIFENQNRSTVELDYKLVMTPPQRFSKLKKINK
jgi:hypothetical protein